MTLIAPPPAPMGDGSAVFFPPQKRGRGVWVLVPVWVDGYPYIQPKRDLVHDGFGHNWTAVSSNRDETGVKRMLSTRSSVLRGPKLIK